MSRRQYGQECPVACALDRIGERWSLLIVRELALGPLRFSDLARAVGGAPTDVLSRRLRDLESDGIVARRELAPPASSVVYELTELGRGLERPVVELGRWGLNFQGLADIAGLAPSSLPNALRVILLPPAETSMTLLLRSEGHDFWLRIDDGWIDAGRGIIEAADLILAGPPLQVIAAVVAGGAAGVPGVEIEGDATLLDELRAMVVIPNQLREEAATSFAEPALAELAAVVELADVDRARGRRFEA